MSLINYEEVVKELCPQTWQRLEDAERKAESAKVEGKEEERKTIAKNMLAKSCDVVFIAEVTGLTIDEIRKLKA